MNDADLMAQVRQLTLEAEVRETWLHLCWCGAPCRLTEWGWGHALMGRYGHPASPTKPIRRHRKKKETA